jgi:hypothetical protein
MIALFILIYKSFAKEPNVSTNFWNIPSYFVAEKEHEENNIYGNTLEFSVESPIPLHAYNTIPILTKNYILKYNPLQDECTNITTLKNKEEIKQNNVNLNKVNNNNIIKVNNKQSEKLVQLRWFSQFSNLSIIQICKGIKLNNFNILNIFIILMFIPIVYIFVYNLNNLYNLLGFSISLIISFIVSNFILNKCKYSDNPFIRFVQKFVIYNLVLICITYLFGFIGWNVLPFADCSGNDATENNNDKSIINVKTNGKDNENYVFTAKKDLVDNLLNTVIIASNIAIKHIAHNTGAGAAGATVGSALVKATTGVAPIPRLALVSSGTLLASASTKLGIDGATYFSENINIMNAIKKYPHSNPNIDRVPSPDSFINAVLEKGDLF